MAQSIPDMIMTTLGNSEKYTTVERVQIDNAIQHFQNEQSDLMNDATAVEIGRWIGANAIIIGNYVQEGGQVTIDTRVVDVNSGTPINSAKVQGSANEIINLVGILSEELLAPITGVNLSSIEKKDYYFQTGDKLLTELNRYEIKNFYQKILVGKLNTGEEINLGLLLNPSKTDATYLESDKTYQITFSGQLRFRAIDFRSGFIDGNPGKTYLKVYIDFYGTDTLKLRPNETNIIQVDLARPPRIISHHSKMTRMRWQLQVANK